MITHNTSSSVILRDSYAYASNFHWRGLEESKTIPVKAQIQSSQAAEFSSKARNRLAQLQEELQQLWKNYPGMCYKQGRQDSAAVLHRASALCQWMDGPTAPAAQGEAILGRNLPGISPSAVGLPVSRICSLS